MLRRTFFLAFVCLFATVSLTMAEKPAKKAAQKPATLFKLPKKFVVHAVGIHQGTIPLEKMRLDDSGQAVTQADVVVNLHGAPVVLVLTAYNPTVWHVGVTPETEIAAILVSGYHGQALTGVSKDIPVAISTSLNRGAFTPFRASGASPELLAMNDSIARLVGREMERFVFQPQDGVFLVGEPLGDGVEPVYSDGRPLHGYVAARKREKPAASPGEAAIERLVKSGRLRRATRDDIEEWVDKASEPYTRFNPELRVAHHMREGKTFVVLKKLTLPEGLFGAHACSFIVPAGIPAPDGEMGHCSFHMMDGTVRRAGQ